MPGKNSVNFAACLILIGVQIAWLGTAPALADQEKSENLYSEAIRHFGQQRYKKALALLQEAAAQTPPYYLAVYYLGVTYGKLGQYKQAATHLERALQLLNSSPKKDRPGAVAVRQDLAVAYYHLQRFGQALDLLEQARQAAPENGLILFYKGLCQYRQGNEAEARASLRRAAELEETVRKLRLPLDSPQELAKRLQEQSRQRDARWQVRLGLGGQYDSNIILEPDQPPDAQAISDQNGFRLALSGGGSFDLWPAASGGLIISYDFFQSLHNDVSDFDLQAHLARLAASWLPSHRLRLGIEGGGGYFLLGGDSYLREIHLMPSLAFAVKPWTSTSFSYRLSGTNYLLPLFDPARDGMRHRILVRQYFFPFEDSSKQFFVGYGYQREDPDSPLGDDFQYGGNQFEAGARLRIGSRTVLDLSYLHRDNDYSFANSRSGFREKRRDNLHGVLAQLSRELTPRLVLRFGYRGRFNDSNIDDFQYDRHIASVDVRFVLGKGQ